MKLFFTILGSVFGGIVLIIALILCLPLHVFIKTDEEKGIALTGRLLFLKFGEKPDPTGAALKLTTSILGVKELGGVKELKESLKTSGTASVVSRVAGVLKTVLCRVFWILKYCHLKKLYIKAVCASKDAAEAAMDYGAASALIYPLAGYLCTVKKPKKDAADLNVICGFDEAEREFTLDMHITVRVAHVEKALLYIIVKNVEREVYSARKTRSLQQRDGEREPQPADGRKEGK